MKKKQSKDSGLNISKASLRTEAEIIIQKNAALTGRMLKTMSFEQIEQMFNELHMYQVELEMQNKELQSSLKMQKQIFYASRDALMTLEAPSWRFTEVNETALRLFGVSSVSEFALLGPWNISPEFQPDGRRSDKKAQEMIAIAMSEGSSFFEWEHQRLNGEIFVADVLLTKIEIDGKIPFLRATVLDNSERKEMQKNLTQSETRFRNLVESSPDWVWEVDTDGRFTYSSSRIHDILGYYPEEIIGRTPFELMPSEEAERVAVIFADKVTEKKPFFNLENINLHKNGNRIVLETSGVPILGKEGLFLGYQGIDRDITQRHKNLEHIQKLTNMYGTLSKCNHAITHTNNSLELFKEICKYSVQIGKMSMAWIGLIDVQTAQVFSVASYGDEKHYLEGIKISTLENTPSGKGPTGTAIREDRPFWCNDFINDPATLLWHERGKTAGWRASAALPIHQNGVVIGAFMLYSATLNVFGPMMQKLIIEMTNDLSYAMDSFNRIAKREEAEIKLHNSLLGLIKAMAYTVEIRDAYTAGHQKRVAALSIAIGKKIGISEDRIMGLELAAKIHDIGKIQVPAEILSKPSRLSEIEFALIKVHPEIGYDILKEIEFPWPIATIIRQHHEKLDGSGYPHGLKGEEILLEARIITVADIVEAIANHRPYRPALGIDFALEVITKERGTKLDADVVDACVVLFNEKEFYFL